MNSSNEIVIRVARQADVARIAELYRAYMRRGFLIECAPWLIKDFHGAMIDRKDIICLVAENSRGQVEGFITAAEDGRRFHKSFMASRAPILAWKLLPVVLKAAFWKKLMRVLRPSAKEEARDYNLPRAEWLNLTVEAKYQGTGVSEMLFRSMVEEFRHRASDGFHFIVSADNLRSLGFCQKMGCVVVGEIVSEGVPFKLLAYNMRPNTICG